MIQYEYPFNERIRTYLRLEHLFGHYAELSVRDTPVDHHYALYSLFEILEITSRSDLKKEIMLDLTGCATSSPAGATTRPWHKARWTA